MLDDLTDTVFRLDLWKDALPLFACMSPGTQYRLINVQAMSRAEVLEAVVVNTDVHGLWGTLLPLVEYMSPQQRETVGGLVLGKGDNFLKTVVNAAETHDMWAPLLDVIRLLSPETRQAGLPSVKQALQEQSPARAQHVRALAAERGLEDLLV